AAELPRPHGRLDLRHLLRLHRLPRPRAQPRRPARARARLVEGVHGGAAAAVLPRRRVWPLRQAPRPVPLLRRRGVEPEPVPARRAAHAARPRYREACLAALRLDHARPLPRHARLPGLRRRPLPRAPRAAAPPRRRRAPGGLPHLGRGRRRRRVLRPGGGRKRRDDRRRLGGPAGRPLRPRLRPLLAPTHDRGRLRPAPPARRRLSLRARPLCASPLGGIGGTAFVARSVLLVPRQGRRERRMSPASWPRTSSDSGSFAAGRAERRSLPAAALPSEPVALRVLQPVERRRRRRRWPRRLLLAALVAAAAALAVWRFDPFDRTHGARPGSAAAARASSRKPGARGPLAARRPVRPLRLLTGPPALRGHRFGPPLRAASAIVVDARTGRVLWALHPHKRRPIASTTKIMTAVLTLQRLPLHRLITVDPAAT